MKGKGREGEGKGIGREGKRWERGGERRREEGKRREGGKQGVHLTHFAFRTMAAMFMVYISVSING